MKATTMKIIPTSAAGHGVDACVFMATVAVTQREKPFQTIPNNGIAQWAHCAPLLKGLSKRIRVDKPVTKKPDCCHLNKSLKQNLQPGTKFFPVHVYGFLVVWHNGRTG